MEGFEVTLAHYTGNPYADVFLVNVKGGSINETCTLQRGASPLRCPFTGLFSGSQYTIRAIACMPNQQGCSHATKTTAWTIPHGKGFIIKVSWKSALKTYECILYSTSHFGAPSEHFNRNGWSWATWGRPSYTALPRLDKEWDSNAELYNNVLHSSIAVCNPTFDAFNELHRCSESLCSWRKCLRR